MNTNVVVNHAIVMQGRQSGPGFLVRAAWFLFIGWWLSALWIGVAYVLAATIIGLPVAFAMFNLVPAVMTLRPRDQRQTVMVQDGVTYLRGDVTAQLPMWIRIVWFLCVGWWLGYFYIVLAWALCVTVIGLPIGLLMLNRVGSVMTLFKN